MKTSYDLSAIIVYYEKYEYDAIQNLFTLYKKHLDETNLSYEIIVVIDGNMPEAIQDLKEASAGKTNIKIIKLGRWFGDATSLQAGFEASSGEKIITLPSYQQVEANEIPKLIETMEDNDMVVGWRWPRIDGFLNNI